MFTTLAKSGLSRLRLIQLRRIAPGPHQAAFSHQQFLNDNLPGFRRPAAAGKRRAPTPALACDWVLTGANRLECRWNVRDPALCDDPAPPLQDFTQRSSNGLIGKASAEAVRQLTSASKSDAVLEQVVGRLSLEPTVSAARWSVGPILE
jgi:hypothetical protein